jgi:eukaryotic-like serine/threonine-protein kinase
MAEVYRGLDTTLNRTVAIKVLKPPFASDESFVERFRREAQAAARLNHPNVVSVYDTGADNGTNYIVMEYVEGRTLADFISRGGRLAPMKAVEIAEKIADALAAAHAQGVIHRDIKPANIMVTRDGVVKVMDFGIARLTTSKETIEQTAAVLGTAAYLSPEQAQGQPVDARTDVYSLGCVLYEMLTGGAPFTGDTAVAIAYKHVQETPAPPSSKNPELSPALDAVVMRALAKNPANRYQTAADFRDDLERLRNGQDVLATPLLPHEDATQVISRHSTTQVMAPIVDDDGGDRNPWLVALIVALILAVIGGLGYLLAQSLIGGGATPSPTPKVVTMPSVIGDTQDVATTKLTNLKLHVVPSYSQTDPTATPGTVIAQDPKATTSLHEGDTVHITVARAPKQVAVPSVVGDTVPEARAALKAAGFDLGTQTQAASDTVPVDHIISQDPSADTKVDPGTPVNVVVSTGQAQVSVPDVTCFSYGHAKAVLGQSNLTIENGGSAPAPNPSCPQANRVAMQQPDAGTMVDSGSTVTVFFAEKSPSPSPT